MTFNPWLEERDQNVSRLMFVSNLLQEKQEELSNTTRILPHAIRCYRTGIATNSSAHLIIHLRTKEAFLNKEIASLLSKVGQLQERIRALNVIVEDDNE